MVIETGIANEFNKVFTNIGPELTGKTLTASRTFENFLSKIDITMPVDQITINELKEPFFSLKTNRIPKVNSGVIELSP